jgi:Holliday junction resolvase RusA-like endonuclease
MKKHRLVLDGWRPWPLNRLLRMHWSRRLRALKGDAAVVAAEALRQGVPRAAGRRRVSLTVLHRAGRSKPDGDALWKGLLDALVKCGRLMDDGPAHCELGPVGYEVAPRKGLVVVLEDLGG